MNPKVTITIDAAAASEGAALHRKAMQQIREATEALKKPESKDDKTTS